MSRKSKRVVSILLTMVLVCGCAMTASAAPNWRNWWGGWLSYISEETAGEPEEEVRDQITLDLTKNTLPTKASRKISLDWNTVEDCDGYELQRSTTGDFSTGVTSKETTNSLYNLTIMGVSPAIYYYPAHSTYYFRVRAIYGADRGDWSNMVVAPGR